MMPIPKIHEYKNVTTIWDLPDFGTTQSLIDSTNQTLHEELVPGEQGRGEGVDPFGGPVKKPLTASWQQKFILSSTTSHTTTFTRTVYHDSSTVVGFFFLKQKTSPDSSDYLNLQIFLKIFRIVREFNGIHRHFSFTDQCIIYILMLSKHHGCSCSTVGTCMDAINALVPEQKGVSPR